MTPEHDEHDEHESEDFEEAVRKTAYFLWEQDGRPHGRHEEYYLRALDIHRRARTFGEWLNDEPVPNRDPGNPLPDDADNG